MLGAAMRFLFALDAVVSACVVSMQGAKDVQNQPSVGFSGSADGLQINVGLPSPGGVADKV
jgi:hypothetical protein